MNIGAPDLSRGTWGNVTQGQMLKEQWWKQRWRNSWRNWNQRDFKAQHGTTIFFVLIEAHLSYLSSSICVVSGGVGEIPRSTSLRLKQVNTSAPFSPSQTHRQPAGQALRRMVKIPGPKHRERVLVARQWKAHVMCGGQWKLKKDIL